MPINVEIDFGDRTGRQVPFEAMPRVGEKIAMRDEATGEWAEWLVVEVIHYTGHDDFEAALRVVPVR